MKPPFAYPWLLLLNALSLSAAAESWKAIAEEEALRILFTNTTMTAKLSDGAAASAVYSADGTGVVQAYGDTFDRTWYVRRPDQICIEAREQCLCYRLEADLDAPGRFRATSVSSDEQLVFTVLNNGETVALDRPTTGKGAAAEPSADEIAAALANPNTPLASLTTKLQYRGFKGELPGADDQNGATILIQPSFPFALQNGDLILFRPALPILVNQPSFVPGRKDFRNKSGLGDITFDLAYARTLESGLLLAGGFVSTLPAATDDSLGNDRWTLGPELLIGKIAEKYVIGAFPNHQWDIAGSGEADINLTTVQLFGTYLPGAGWNVGSAPIMSYDHEANQWTVPLNFSLGRTLFWGGRPWKIGVEINHYVEQGDSFGPDWMVGISLAPVVENVLARFFQ